MPATLTLTVAMQAKAGQEEWVDRTALDEVLAEPDDLRFLRPAADGRPAG